ncbi:MAG: ABC transporter permease [Deltaproteobacteria bacterium]|nr:ABC transporter permease [Deltaproteobacteria bacterium]MBW2200351.1 ABC transporter permease [Deltaproteobacteria bacterium]
MLLQLGWRNIWRNPRRTLIIMTAVIIGVWSMIFLGGLMRGIADQMVRNGIATLTGHIQVHHNGYRSDPVVENSMSEPQAVATAIKKLLPAGTQWTSRVRVNAVASNARHAGSVTLLGIDPKKEVNISFIGNAVTQGRYLTTDDRNGIIVGKALADKFETRLGRKLVLMSQDTGHEIASRAFHIVGIFRAEMEATEKQFVFITRPAAQNMLKLKNAISEIVIILPVRQEVNPATTVLRNSLPSTDYEVHSWQDLLPLLTAILKMYDTFIFLWFLVVFIAMSFGIANTMLMAVFERIREFGLLKALGMKPWWIIKEVLYESFFLLILGMVIGNILGFLSVLTLSGHGIDLSSLAAGLEFAGMSRVIYPVIHIKDVIIANLVVLGLGLLVSMYPAVKAARFTPVQAMAHT